MWPNVISLCMKKSLSGSLTISLAFLQIIHTLTVIFKKIEIKYFRLILNISIWLFYEGAFSISHRKLKRTRSFLSLITATKLPTIHAIEPCICLLDKRKVCHNFIKSVNVIQITEQCLIMSQQFSKKCHKFIFEILKVRVGGRAFICQYFCSTELALNLCQVIRSDLRLYFLKILRGTAIKRLSYPREL